MADWVSGDEAVELQYMLEMFSRADIALSPLLDAIISVPGYQPTVSMACLLWHNREENIQNSRFEQDDDDKAITAQINARAFNNQSILKERARQAIENLLNQPEPGHTLSGLGRRLDD